MKGYEELKKQRTNLIYSKSNDKNELLQSIEKQIDDYINLFMCCFTRNTNRI